MEGKEKPKHWSEERKDRGQAPTPQQFTDAQLTKMRASQEEAAKYAEVPETVKARVPTAEELAGKPLDAAKPMAAPSKVPAPEHVETPLADADARRGPSDAERSAFATEAARQKDAAAAEARRVEVARGKEAAKDRPKL